MRERVIVAIDSQHIPSSLNLVRMLKRFVYQKHQMSIGSLDGSEVALLALSKDSTNWFVILTRSIDMIDLF